MEISNNINSVIVDIDKLTFKKNGADGFVIDLQPDKELVTNTNVLKSNAPLELDNIYLTGLPSTDKSILTKVQNIDTSFNKIDASLIDLYNNGGGGTFSGAAAALQFGSSQVNLPSIIGSDSQVLSYNSSTGTFGWSNGSGNSNTLLFGSTQVSLPSAVGATGQVLALNNATNTFYWVDRSSGGGSGGVDSTIFNNFVSSVDNSFNIVENNIIRIDASINTRIDISLEELKTSIGSDFYTTSILDNSFTDLSGFIHDISNVVTTNATNSNTNFSTLNTKVEDVSNILHDICGNFDTKFNTVNSNFTIFDNYITDICDTHLKPLVDNSNSLLFGSIYKSLPTTFGANNQVLISDGNELTWATQSGSGGGTTYDDTIIVNRMNTTDASYLIIDASFDKIDTSFALTDSSFTSINQTFNNFDNIIIRIDNSLNDFKTDIASNLSNINSHNSTHLNNHNSLTSTVSTLTNNVNNNATDIATLSTSISNCYTKTILDNSYTDISTSLSNLNSTIVNNNNATTNKFYYVDLSFNKIDTSLNTITSNINQDITNLESSNNNFNTNINNINTNISSVNQTTATLASNIALLNNKKNDYLDTEDGQRITMPTQRPPGKALVVSNDTSKFEWANVKEITRDSDVNLLNLNVYGSTDVSGNIRVSDEIIVGMTDAKESIRTTGSIKTNTMTLHKLVFPNNLDHPERVIDISQQDIYHDVSGIHLTKTYLHDVDISGIIKPLPTNSIVTPLGVTIKFL